MKITIKTITDLHIGSGQTDGIVDNDIITNAKGQPFIPASSIKGILKDSCRQVSELLELKVCDGQHIQADGKKLCGISFSSPYGSEPCLICQIFGSYGHEGKLRVYDAQPQNFEHAPENNGQKYMVTGHNRIDRKTGATVESGLFIARHVPAGTVFTSELYFESINEKILPVAEAFLKLGLLNLKRIGGKRRRGKGGVEIIFDGKAANEAGVKKLIDIVKTEVNVDNTTYQAAPEIIASSSFNPVTVELSFELKTPMIINDNQLSGNHFETLTYIPSTNVSGLFFSRFMSKFNDAGLLKKFMDGGLISFPDLYISNGKSVCMPWPKTLLTCSKAKGETKGHTKPKFCFDGEETLCECKAPMEPKRNTYCSYGYEGEKIIFEALKGPHKKVRMRNNIDPKLQTTRSEGGLYSYQEIIEGQTFCGTVKFASEKIFELWKSVIFNGTEEIDASFGRGRSRGLGAGKLRYKIASKDSGFSFPIEKRSISPDGRCVVMFISDTILLDEYLAPASSIPLDYLKNILPGVEFEIDENNTMLNFKVKRGFNAHKGLPAIPEAVITPGSVFVLKFKDFTANKDKIFDFLNKLEFYGIGERTGEGFGRLAAAPFGIKSAIEIKEEKAGLSLKIEPDRAKSLLSPLDVEIREKLQGFMAANKYSIDYIPSVSSLNSIASAIKSNPNSKSAIEALKREAGKSTAKEKWYINIWLPGKKEQTSFINFILNEELTGNDEKASKTIFWLMQLLKENKKSKNNR